MVLRLETGAWAEDLVPEWDELADRVEARPWLRPGWILAWWRAFGAGRLEPLALRRGGRLAGILPMVVHDGVVRSPTNWHTPEFAMLAEDDEGRRELARAALERRPRQLAVSFVDPVASGLEECRETARAEGYRVLERTVARSPYLPVESDWPRFEASLGGGFRKGVRRHRRRLAREGPLRFEVHDGSRRLDQLLEEGFGVEASGWKGRNRTAILSSPRTRRFYEEVARWAAERGWLRLAFLRVSSEPVAFEYLIECDRIAYDLKAGYDERYRGYSPGQLLVHEIIRRAFASRLRCFEFLGDEDEFKAHWTHAAHERRRLQAFAPSLTGLVDWTAWSIGRPVAKRALGLLGRR